VLATKKKVVLDTGQTTNKELCLILISRVQYKKETVLNTSQTAKKVNWLRGAACSRFKDLQSPPLKIKFGKE